MTTQKLMMFAVAGLLVPVANAAADVKRPTTEIMIPHPVTDTAPVTGNPPRLRRTNEEQAGVEDTTLALFAREGTAPVKGLYFGLTTELNGQRPTRPNTRVQLSMTPFTLIQDPDGTVRPKPDLAAAKFVTDNDGQEYRNANVAVAWAVNGGKQICVNYNYQPKGTGDTDLEIKCFNPDGSVALEQTTAFENNNDDVCGSIEGNTPAFIDKPTPNSERYIRWCLGNGNNDDAAWALVSTITETAPGKLSFQRNYDLIVLQDEERSRGMCSVGPDKTFAVCAGTEGNNQPQRRGAWVAAIDLTPGKFSGRKQQGALLWKRQLGGRAQVEGQNTYAMRAMVSRIMTTDAAGNPVASDMLFYRHGALQGENNNNRKGGRYIGNQIGVIKVSRTGLTFVTPLSNQAYTSLLGVDGTHNLVTSVLVGQGNQLKPAMLVHNGDHTGGNAQSQVRVLGWDQAAGATEAAKAFTNLGETVGGFHDRHYYPNYLGNNPGNQGRGHAQALFIKNPYFGENGNNDQHIVLYATAGKGTNMNPATKLAGYLAVMPVTQGAPAAGGGTGGGEGGGEGEEGGSDTTLGGCSTGGSTGLASLLLIGLAAFIRRRR